MKNSSKPPRIQNAPHITRCARACRKSIARTAAQGARVQSHLLNRTPPLVQEWSSPKKVRLTAEGRALAKTLLATAITMGKIDSVPGFDAAAWNAAAQAQRAADDAANPPAPKKSRAKATKAAAPPVGAAGASTSGVTLRWRCLNCCKCNHSDDITVRLQLQPARVSRRPRRPADGCRSTGRYGD